MMYPSSHHGTLLKLSFVAQVTFIYWVKCHKPTFRTLFILVFDADNDQVRCRWAKNKECGGICGAPDNIELRRVCSIIIVFSINITVLLLMPSKDNKYTHLYDKVKQIKNNFFLKVKNYILLDFKAAVVYFSNTGFQGQI